MATIGIDVSALSTPASGGIGTSQYRTMQALVKVDTTHRFVMYAAKPPVVPFTDEPLDLPWDLRLGKGLAARSNIVWMQTGVNRQLAADGIDVFWSPRHLLPFRAKGIATVATIQDFWHLYHPEQQPPLNRIANRELIKRVAEHADRIVTTSSATAADAHRFYRVPMERIDVVPLGVDTTVFHPLDAEKTDAVRQRHGLTRPYVLALDVFNPRKNFATLLHAVASLDPETRAGFEVIGVGRPRKTANEIDPFAKSVALGLRGHVRVLDDVSAEDLVGLYGGALALAYPSVYEGFGMPVLEAMACGCPVVAGDRSSIPEVAGDAALLVDPQSAEELAAAIRRLVTDESLRASLRALGLERAAVFTWARTAEGMLAAFERALAHHAAGGEA